MTSIICLFELVHVNDLLFDEWVNHVVKKVNVKEALKSSIFVVQKAAVPKNGVEFRQGSNGTIRNSLTTSYDVSRRRVCVGTFLKVVSKPTNRPTYLSLDVSFPKHKNTPILPQCFPDLPPNYFLFSDPLPHMGESDMPCITLCEIFPTKSHCQA